MHRIAQPRQRDRIQQRREDVHAWQPAGHRRAPRRAGPIQALLAGALLLIAGSAAAQTARNGPEYGGKDHQPTQAEVIRRERQDGVAPSQAERKQDDRSVQQLDQQLLHDEAVDPASKAAPPASR